MVIIQTLSIKCHIYYATYCLWFICDVPVLSEIFVVIMHLALLGNLHNEYGKQHDEFD